MGEAGADGDVKEGDGGQRNRSMGDDGGDVKEGGGVQRIWSMGEDGGGGFVR